MKKIMLALLGSAIALIFMFGAGNVLAQTSPNSAWVQINSPIYISELTSVTVATDGRIFATSPGTCYVSGDRGNSWTSYSITLPSQYIDHAVWFSNRLYVGCDTGIISSPDGSSWRLEKAGYGFPSICCNDQYLFIFGHNNNSWKTNGTVWTQITQPATVVDAACASNTVLTAAVGSEIYQSYNNGQTWTSSGNLGIQILDISANGSQYEAAGFNNAHTMQACGQYPYNYSGGDIRCTIYFNGVNLTGGKQTLSPSFYQGIVMENGDLASAAIFSGNVIGFSCNSDFVIANILGFDLYLREADISSAINEKPSLSLDAYPNPVTDNLGVTSYKLQSVSLYDFFGQKLIECQLTVGRNMIDISQLPPGVYLLTNGKIREKIVKK